MDRKALVVITWKAQPFANPLETQVLLLQVTEARGGFWQPVTGKVEEGETFLEGALREAIEETGFRFERRPQPLGLDFEFLSRHGTPVLEKAFLLPLVGGISPPVPTLDPREHQGHRWVSGKEASQAVKFPGNQKAIARAAQGTPPLFLSRSGAFFQEGEEITHGRTLLLLHRSLARTSSGFLVRVGTEELDVVVEATPRFVSSYNRESGEIYLSHGERETLNPLTLQVQPDHSITCQTQEGWMASFLSAAHYELAKDIREGSVDGEFFFHFLGRDYLLAVSP